MTQNGMNKEFEHKVDAFVGSFNRMTVHGMYCWHIGCDINNIAMCHYYQGDCCYCFRHSCCCADRVKNRGCGLVTNKDAGECCKIGCYCCDVGLLSQPRVFCASTRQTLCCYEVRQCPLNSNDNSVYQHMSDPVCAICCFQCLPTVGCAASPGELQALDHIHKNRNLDVYSGYVAPQQKGTMERS